jgi:hypothetical protein
VPFIRVPYSNLVPDDQEVERRDVSRHHQAIHAFAAFLARQEGEAAGALLEQLASVAGAWTEGKAWVGRLLGGAAARLTGAADGQISAKATAAAEVARRVLSPPR